MGLAQFPLNLYKSYYLNWNETILDKFFWKLFLKPSKRKSDILLQLLRKENPDIIHIHYGSDAAIYLPTIKKSNIPSLVSFYGYDCTGFPKYYLGLGKILLKNRVFLNASMITAMSRDMKKDIINLGCVSDKILVHYHGIITKSFNLERDYQSDPQVSLLIISSFSAQKGHIFLLKAFQNAFNKNKNLHLTIVGNGIEKKSIEKFINDKSIQNVVLKESVKYSSAEHLDYLSKADIFIHPSITDPFGNKEGIPGSIVEAMSTGIPVISTFHAGIPEIVDHLKTGYLVKENDIEKLSEAILTLANQPELRETLGKNAKKYALTQLDILLKEDELERIYLQLINNVCAVSAE